MDDNTRWLLRCFFVRQDETKQAMVSSKKSDWVQALKRLIIDECYICIQMIPFTCSLSKTVTVSYIPFCN